jgi:anti-sigma regulatory factor (Ser/Thr protein kinase)
MVDDHHDWVTKRVAEAQSELPLDKALTSVMALNLRNTLCKKQLRSADLAVIANALIEAARNFPSGETDNEN